MIKTLIKISIWISASLSLIAAGFCFWCFYSFYLIINFNQEGRFFDPQEAVVYHDSNLAWGIVGGFFLLMAVLLFFLNYTILKK